MAKQLSAPARRTFVSAIKASSRPTAARAVASAHQVRGVKTIDFAGVKEDVYGMSMNYNEQDQPLISLQREPTGPPPSSKYIYFTAHLNYMLINDQEYFKNDTMAIIGYGSQGHAQSLNMRDQGLNVVVGVRKNGQSWKDAQQDGWVPGKNLFEVDEAISKGTIIMNLLSDAAQSETWPAIKPQITKGKVRNVRRYLSFHLTHYVDSLLLPWFLTSLQGPNQGRCAN